MAQDVSYTVPINSNAKLNALGTQFPLLGGFPTTDIIIKDLRHDIFDSSPMEYYADLVILNRQESVMTKDTEFSWTESGWARDGVITTAATTGGGFSITLPVSSASTTAVSVDFLLAFPNGQIGIVQSISTTLNTITINMQQGQTAPNVAAGAVLTDVATMDADGVNGVESGSFRIQLIEKFNFIQPMAKRTNWGVYELERMKRSGVTNYLEENNRKMIDQFRCDFSNTFWMGTAGMVTLRSGAVTSTSDGVQSLMNKAGSPSVTSTLSNIGGAIEAIALSTEFGTYGQMKFAYMTPTLKRAVAKYYKDPNLRYDVMSGTIVRTEDVAPLTLQAVDIGSSYVVLVPYQRYQDTASFPTSWQNSIYMLDHKNIIPAHFFGEQMITTPSRNSGINERQYTNTVIWGDFSLYFYNAPSSGSISIT